MRLPLPLVAVLLFTTLVLAGCGESPSSTPTSTPTTATSTTPTGTTDCTASPELTIGPYYIDAKDRSDIRSDSSGTLVEEGHEMDESDEAEEDEANEPPTAEYLDATQRADILLDSSGAAQEGATLVLKLTFDELVNGACVPLAGAKIDIWHANAQGHYSGFAQEGTLGQDWLRGWQTTDSDGQVTFTTIWPGWYPGRAIHIHVRVREGSNDFTSQFFFDEAMAKQVYAGNSAYTANGKSTTADTPNSRDGIYNQGGNRMILVTAGSGSYTGTKTVIVPN